MSNETLINSKVEEIASNAQQVAATADSRQSTGGSYENTVENNRISDASWLRQSFLLNSKGAGANIKLDSRRAYDMSRYKYADTTPGGYRAINPPPQITRYADVKNRPRSHLSRGMGRYFSEAYDDNAQIVSMRMGVPEYNSLANYISRAYEPSAGKLARTGEGDSFILSIVKAATTVVLFPIKALTFLWREAGALFLNIPFNKFYYLQPAMPLYFNAVNTMLTKLAVDMGLLDPAIPVDQIDSELKNSATSEGSTNNPSFSLGSNLSTAERDAFHKLLPDIFDPDTGFDIYAISTRYQRLANANARGLRALQEQATSNADLEAKLETYYESDVTGIERSEKMPDLLDAYLKTGFAKPKPKADTKEDSPSDTAAASSSSTDPAKEIVDKSSNGAFDTIKPPGGWFDKFGHYLEGEIYGGSQWVNFRVNSTGTTNESFSNSTADNPLKDMVNGFSSKARATKHSTAGGDLGDGIIGSSINWVAGNAASIVSHLGNEFGAGGVAAVLSGGHIEFPQHIDGSSASLPKADYTIPLRAMTGNKLSIFKDIYIPMCMLLGAALPKSTGPNSYTTPFLVELFDKGRLQTRLGVIDNLSITRGVGNLGWSIDNLPVAVDINFSVVDLEELVHMPITGESNSFNDRSKYQDYMAALAGRGILEQITVGGKWNGKINRLTAEFNKFWSADHIASWAGDTSIGRIAQGIVKNSSIIN